MARFFYKIRNPETQREARDSFSAENEDDACKIAADALLNFACSHKPLPATATVYLLDQKEEPIAELKFTFAITHLNDSRRALLN